jgi:hypothetical protein
MFLNVINPQGIALGALVFLGLLGIGVAALDRAAARRRKKK